VDDLTTRSVPVRLLKLHLLHKLAYLYITCTVVISVSLIFRQWLHDRISDLVSLVLNDAIQLVGLFARLV